MSQTYKYARPLAWAEIDLKAVRHNFRELKKLAFKQLKPKINRNVDLLSVVKADSYGHGMIEVARVIEKESGRFFAVSNLEEAIALRKSGNRHRILLFEATLPELAKSLVQYDLTPAVSSMELVKKLDHCGKKAKRKVAIHVKIDTGMGRLGVWHEDVLSFVRETRKFKNIHVEGFFTHFPVADTDRDFTGQQIEDFSNVVVGLSRDQVPFKYLHAANSMGLGAYTNRFFNLVRPGVALYGLYPGEGAKKIIFLKPVMSVKATVLFVKTIHRGRGISYGHTFRAKKDLPVAIVSIGYSDGYFRAFSNKAHVLIRGEVCPVLGRVTMDQIIVDISKVGRVNIGDEVVVMGRQGRREILADDLADWAGTINYEIVCNLGNRLPRIYLK